MNNTKLFAGIDSSQKNNQCCLLDHSGKVINEFSVVNNLSGAHELEAVLARHAQKLQSGVRYSETYWTDLRILILENERYGVLVDMDTVGELCNLRFHSLES